VLLHSSNGSVIKFLGSLQDIGFLAVATVLEDSGRIALHDHNGVMDMADFDGMVDLVVALVQKLDAKTVTQLRDFTPEP
jgi:putative aminopeptidase FrvX